MSSRPAQFVAIAAALVLALPPGWCAGLCPHCAAQASHKHASANQPAPATHACCKHAKQAEPTRVNSLNAPAPDCCCSVQAAATPGKVVPTPTLDSQVIAPIAALPLVTVDADVESALVSLVDPFHTGPPIRVLQCVWRC